MKHSLESAHSSSPFPFSAVIAACRTSIYILNTSPVVANVAASRRAVSPVIATVILIAVAVALGVAVAVWAGALTGGLQRPEKLLVLFASVSGGQVNVTITNKSPNPVTVSQVYFNDVLVPAGNITGNGTDIPSGATVVLSFPMTGQSGISYPLTVWLTSGGSYPATVDWP
jgi:flagellin-like protein